MDDITRTTGLADGALSLIKALKLPATPRMYELCYAYATGEYPTVNIAINELLGRRASVEGATIEQIAARYLSHGHPAEKLHSVGTRVANEIERALGSLNTMSSTIDECSSDFADAGEKYSSADRDAVKAGIDQLIQSSGNICNEQRRLEAALNASSSEINSLRDELQQITSAAGSDPLTGLPNRDQFKPLLAKAIGESAERGTLPCLAFSDIDDFTAFNENWGFDRGDQVLRLVAAEMKQKFGHSGTVVRSGGAQFAVILHGGSITEAGAIADDIRQSVMKREVTIRSTGQKLGRVGISFGIAGARPHDTGETLASRALECLQSAKRLGRNRVICEDGPAAASHAAVA